MAYPLRKIVQTYFQPFGEELECGHFNMYPEDGGYRLRRGRGYVPIKARRCELCAPPKPSTEDGQAAEVGS